MLLAGGMTVAASLYAHPAWSDDGPRPKTTASTVGLKTEVSANPSPLAGNIIVPPGVPFVRVTRTMYKPLQEIFYPFVQADVTHIFTPRGQTPGTTKTTISKGWNHPGLHRESTQSDGSTYTEDLLTVEPNRWFSYRVQDFTSPALQAIDHIEGMWVFTDNGNATTNIEWIYVLFPRDEARRGEVQDKLIPRYQARMEHAINVMKGDAEGVAVN